MLSDGLEVIKPVLCSSAVSELAAVVDDSLWMCEGGGVSGPRNTDTPNSQEFVKPVGIDYLKAAFAGEWLESPGFLFSLLAEAKESAFKEGVAWWEVEYRGKRFLVSSFSGAGRGSNHLRFRVRWRGITFDVSGREESSIGAGCEIRGQELMAFGLVGCLDICREFLQSIGFSPSESRLSRVDLFCDVRSFVPGDLFQAFQENRMISRARDVTPHFAASRECTTFAVGRRKGKTMLRCYNKLLELRKDPQKLDLYEKRYGKLDRDDAGNLCGILTRVEFEIGREGLKNSSILVSSFEDFVARLVAVVDYLTEHFVRFSSRAVSRTHTTRCEVSKEWGEVSRELRAFAVGGQFGVADEIKRAPVTASRDRSMAAGYLRRFFANRRVEIPQTYHDLGVMLEQLVTGDLFAFAESVNVKARELSGSSLFDSDVTCIFDEVEPEKPRSPFVKNEQTLFEFRFCWAYE